MKRIFSMCLISLIAIVISLGCQKVIKIELNKADPKVVIEALIDDSGQPAQVKLNQTKNFDENNDFQGLQNANVTIADDAGNSELLAMISPGIYETKTLKGIIGRTYFLSVLVNGETFNSTCTMPVKSNLDTVLIYDFTDFGDTLKIVTAMNMDPKGIENYYRHILTVNDTATPSINISSDMAVDGRLLTRGLFYRNDGRVLKKGDSVEVEMQCIDKSVYDYFYSLNQTIYQSAAAPANPISNITGGALGYFSAHTTQTRKIKVP